MSDHLFKKGRPKTGGRQKTSKLMSFRKALHNCRFDVAKELQLLYNRTKDEMLKLEILKLSLQYSQLIPTKSLEEMEDADNVTQLSDVQLLAIASGDTVISAGPESDEAGSDTDDVREGDLDAADALDTAQDESEP